MQRLTPSGANLRHSSAALARAPALAAMTQQRASERLPTVCKAGIVWRGRGPAARFKAEAAATRKLQPLGSLTALGPTAKQRAGLIMRRLRRVKMSWRAPDSACLLKSRD